MKPHTAKANFKKRVETSGITEQSRDIVFSRKEKRSPFDQKLSQEKLNLAMAKLRTQPSHHKRSNSDAISPEILNSWKQSKHSKVVSIKPK